MARMALSMIAEPNDPDTGYVLAHQGGVETLRLIEPDELVPGLGRADALMWRERLAGRIAPGLLDQNAAAERHGFGTLIPTDKEWSAGLDDLGDRAPYLLWTRGAVSFLSTALSDRVTFTSARASTGYGQYVTSELATGVATRNESSWPAVPTESEGTVHKSTLAAGCHTIAVLASGSNGGQSSGAAELGPKASGVRASWSVDRIRFPQVLVKD